MTRATFKQFNTFLDHPLDGEQLDEVFGIFKSKEQREKAERRKLELLASNGNELAKMKLRKLQANDEKLSAGRKASDALKDRQFQSKRAEVEAGERGSSRGYDAETGTVRATMAPRWNGAKGTWEKYDPIKKQWIPNGDTDRYSDASKKRGAQ